MPPYSRETQSILSNDYFRCTVPKRMICTAYYERYPWFTVSYPRLDKFAVWELISHQKSYWYRSKFFDFAKLSVMENYFSSKEQFLIPSEQEPDFLRDLITRKYSGKSQISSGYETVIYLSDYHKLWCSDPKFQNVSDYAIY